MRRRKEIAACMILLAAIVFPMPVCAVEYIFQPLDYPGADGFTQCLGVDGINIVGTYTNDTGAHGFLYDGSTWISLSHPSATGDWGTYARGIDGDNVVGGYWNGSAWVGFLYDGTNWTDLDGYPGVEVGAYGNGIDGNSIVGYYPDGHGFVYDGTSFTTLDYPSSSGTYACDVDGIVIVGFYSDSNQNYHGFSAAPVPEPATMLLLGSGLIGIAGFRRRLRKR